MALDPSDIPINFDTAEAEANKPDIPKNPVYLDKEELEKFNGADGEKPIYIALLGYIYDVTSGKAFYGPGCAYGVFAGKDATRGLAAFNLSSKNKKTVNEEDFKDDYSDLSEKHLDSAKRWQKLFDGKYPIVGYLKKPIIAPSKCEGGPIRVIRPTSAHHGGVCESSGGRLERDKKSTEPETLTSPEKTSKMSQFCILV